MVQISIIIPVYNVAKYIGRCLDSIQAQVFTDYEVICVDDGSTDECASIIKQYAEKNNRIRYFWQTNGGVATARGNGLLQAVGEFVTFIDPDDWVETFHLLSLYKYAVERNLDYVSCDIIEDSASGSFIRNQSFDGDGAYGLLEAILRRKIRGSVCTVLYRKSAITVSGARFGDGTTCPIMEDTFFNIGFLLSNPHVGHIKSPSYHYVIHGGSLSGFEKKSIEWWKSAIVATESILALARGRIDDKVLRYRVSMLKSWMMWANEVPESMFLEYHPEIHWLPKGLANCSGRIIFLLASFGLRDVVLRVYRRLKCILNQK